MAIQLRYLVVNFLLSLQYTDAGGSCQENIYLEVGKQGVVSCHFEDFDIIGWINGSGDVTNTSPFIYMEGSQIYGRGYESGDYDMHPNGSLIINEVKLKNELNYTVLFVSHLAGGNEYSVVPVKVYVPPDPGYPLVHGRTNQVIAHGNTRGFINCSLTGIRPRVHLEWVASPNEISLNSSHRVTDNSDGTYNTYLTSSYKVVNSPTGIVSIICRVAGQMADLFPSVTTVYLLLEQRFPTVNGLANQQHVVLHVNREGELTCSMDKISQDVSLELVTIFPDSSDEILLDNKYHITVNGDDTVNITLTSRFRVLSAIQHFTLKCRVSGQAADKYPEATSVELLVSKSFPAVNGSANQQHVVLHVNREGELTFSMDKVSQDVSLELVTIFPDSSDEILLDNKYHITANGDDTVNITLNSRFRVLSASIQHFTLQCRVSDQAADEYPEATTVELLVTETTDQERESLLSWQSTWEIRLLVFLVVISIIIFWLIVLPMKCCKDLPGKCQGIVANLGHQTDRKEAEHPSIQEKEPLQLVNNKDNIEAVCSQCSHCQEMQTKLLNLKKKNRVSYADSGMSSCPSTASGYPRELEGRNAQDIEAVVISYEPWLNTKV